MMKAYDQFKINIDGLHNLTIVYEALCAKVSPLDITDILRSQIVLAVSALDCYVHDLCENAMLHIFENKDFSDNNSFKNFSITMETLHLIANSTSQIEREFFLLKEIKKNNSYKSFQEPKKISEALSNIGIKSAWVKIGKEIGRESTDIQNQLSLIIDRRNKIAHESDINPSLGIGEKYLINPEMVNTIIEFIKVIVFNIEKIVTDEKIFL